MNGLGHSPTHFPHIHPLCVTSLLTSSDSTNDHMISSNIKDEGKDDVKASMDCTWPV